MRVIILRTLIIIGALAIVAGNALFTIMLISRVGGDPAVQLLIVIGWSYLVGYSIGYIAAYLWEGIET